MKPVITPFAVLLLVGCQQIAEQDANVSNGVAPAPAAEANETANVALPDDRTPLAEPNGPIDPKSAEAAGQVVQHYGALIEQKGWAEAEALWGDPATAASYSTKLKRESEVHLEIGKPGDMEGAAGSIFITVPVIFYGKDQKGADFRRAADVILRRVNDVPGSTEAQRRWHIERIEPKTAG